MYKRTMRIQNRDRFSAARAQTSPQLYRLSRLRELWKIIRSLYTLFRCCDLDRAAFQLPFCSYIHSIIIVWNFFFRTIRQSLAFLRMCHFEKLEVTKQREHRIAACMWVSHFADDGDLGAAKSSLTWIFQRYSSRE